MGLDMYLTTKIYLSAPTPDSTISNRMSTTRQAAAKQQYEAIVGIREASRIHPAMVLHDQIESVEIEIQTAYWRKANAIHKWFVDNVQGGDDNCRSYYVEPEQLRELRDLCRDVLEQFRGIPLDEDGIVDVPLGGDGVPDDGQPSARWAQAAEYAMEELPPQKGFFFGSNKVDRWYLQDLHYTVTRLTEVLDAHDKMAKELDDWYIAMERGEDPGPAPAFIVGDFYYQSSW